MLRSEKGFAMLTAVIFALVFAIGLAAMYHLSRSLGMTSALYERAEYAETLNRSAANAAGEFIEQVILDKATPQGNMLTDPNILTNDLLPSPSADWADSPTVAPDLRIDHGNNYVSRIDIDYVPLTSGFSWQSIKFGTAYQEAAAGNANTGALTYRIHVVTQGPSNRKIESDAIYVVTP